MRELRKIQRRKKWMPRDTIQSARSMTISSAGVGILRCKINYQSATLSFPRIHSNGEEKKDWGFGTAIARRISIVVSTSLTSRRSHKSRASSDIELGHEISLSHKRDRFHSQTTQTTTTSIGFAQIAILHRNEQYIHTHNKNTHKKRKPVQYLSFRTGQGGGVKWGAASVNLIQDTSHSPPIDSGKHIHMEEHTVSAHTQNMKGAHQGYTDDETPFHRSTLTGLLGQCTLQFHSKCALHGGRSVLQSQSLPASGAHQTPTVGSPVSALRTHGGARKKY